jgi:xanthine dehydrogenase small subunit
MNPARRLLLNDRICELAPDEQGLVLAWLRRRMGLVGTKEGCGEGECGACTVLLGERDENGGLRYRAVCSCLLAVGELPGRHLVTIEGLNPPANLNPIQQALVDAGAPQCGFCFPGIVVSLTGFFLASPDLSRQDAISALDGNICRCTGYASILRAVAALCATYAPRLEPGAPRVEQLVAWGVVPEYFLHAAEHLEQGRTTAAVDTEHRAPGAGRPVLLGGGTDLIVQQPELLHRCGHHTEVVHLSRRRELAAIVQVGDRLVIGGGVTVEDLKNDRTFRNLVPIAPEVIDRFASTIIRNRATVAGNLVNASPIGDVTVLLLALGAQVVLKDAGALRGGSSASERTLPLGEFYLGYKDLAMRPGEILTAVSLPLSLGTDRISFEKISQRRYLDIASVNSAARFTLQDDGLVANVCLAFGGVAPIPMLARRTMEFLTGKRLESDTVREAARVLLGEIAPIDDVRGSAAYKRELARRALYGHALRIAPDRVRLEELT